VYIRNKLDRYDDQSSTKYSKSIGYFLAYFFVLLQLRVKLSQKSMSDIKKVDDVSRLPEGWTEEEINASMQEAYESGELQAVDVLGNSEVVEPILDELFTGDEKPLDAHRVLSVVRHLQGKVLTVVDATFTDEKRIKFVKDLVKDCFSQSSNWLYEMSIRDFEETENGTLVETVEVTK